MGQNEGPGGAALAWIRGIREALPGLSQALTQEEERLRRLDEARHLGKWAEDLLSAVGWARLLEEGDRERYEAHQEKADVTGLVVDIAKGLLGMGVERYHAPPELPFGKVLVAMGLGDLLEEEVFVVNVSREARRKGVAEAEVEAELKEGGYVLLRSSEFRELVEEAQRKLEEGTQALPSLEVEDPEAGQRQGRR